MGFFGRAVSMCVKSIEYMHQHLHLAHLELIVLVWTKYVASVVLMLEERRRMGPELLPRIRIYGWEILLKIMFFVLRAFTYPISYILQQNLLPTLRGGTRIRGIDTQADVLRDLMAENLRHHWFLRDPVDQLAMGSGVSASENNTNVST